jgi:hypothetical protein
MYEAGLDLGLGLGHGMGWQPPSNVECRVEFYAGKGKEEKGTRAKAEAEILTEATRVALSLMQSKATSQDSYNNKVVKQVWPKNKATGFCSDNYFISCHCY